MEVLSGSFHKGMYNKEDITMATFEELIQQSGCFGFAYDPDVRECQRCDVKTKCEARCRATMVSKPATVTIAAPADVDSEAEVKTSAKVLVVPQLNKKAEEKPIEKPKKVEKPAEPKPEKPKKAVEKPVINYSPDMPAFKDLPMEELEKLAAERGIDVPSVIEKYSAPNIKRMRLTMALKKTYEVA